jgi:hypothetical protein
MSEFDIVAFIEIKLDDRVSDKSIEVNNFELFRADRNCNGGGIALYVNSGLRALLCDDINNKFREKSLKLF